MLLLNYFENFINVNNVAINYSIDIMTMSTLLLSFLLLVPSHYQTLLLDTFAAPASSVLHTFVAFVIIEPSESTMLAIKLLLLILLLSLFLQTLLILLSASIVNPLLVRSSSFIRALPYTLRQYLSLSSSPTLTFIVNYKNKNKNKNKNIVDWSRSLLQQSHRSMYFLTLILVTVALAEPVVAAGPVPSNSISSKLSSIVIIVATLLVLLLLIVNPPTVAAMPRHRAQIRLFHNSDVAIDNNSTSDQHHYDSSNNNINNNNNININNAEDNKKSDVSTIISPITRELKIIHALKVENRGGRCLASAANSKHSLYLEYIDEKQGISERCGALIE